MAPGILSPPVLADGFRRLIQPFPIRQQCTAFGLPGHQLMGRGGTRPYRPRLAQPTTQSVKRGCKAGCWRTATS